MTKKPLNEAGFVPLLVAVLLIVAAIVYFAYTRVLHAHQ